MRLPAVAVGLALALGLAGCSTAASSDGPARTQTLTVLAAASLTESFTALANDFEHAHPGVAVRLSFGGSSALAQQVLAGAPADVFASANPATMDTVTAAGQATTPTVFASNTLEIAVPPDNPAGVNERATTWPDPGSRWRCAPRRCRAATRPRRCSRRPASRSGPSRWSRTSRRC